MRPALGMARVHAQHRLGLPMAAIRAEEDATSRVAALTPGAPRFYQPGFALRGAAGLDSVAQPCLIQSAPTRSGTSATSPWGGR